MSGRAECGNMVVWWPSSDVGLETVVVTLTGTNELLVTWIPMASVFMLFSVQT